MSQRESVNLFQPIARMSPVYQVISRWSKTVSLVLLILLFISASVMILFSKYIDVRMGTIEAQRADIRARIDADVVKEGLLIDLKQRVGILSGILKDQKSLTPYIDTMKLVMQGKEIQSFSLGEKNTVSMQLSFSSVDDALGTVRNILSLMEQNKLTDPTIDSLMVDKDAGIQMTITYSVVL